MATPSHFFALLALTFFSLALAIGNNPLQDFCVADPNMLVNGFACKDPKLVDANDFFFSGLHLAGNTSNTVGSIITPVTVTELPGLNALGICLGRIDFAPKGIQPPHTPSCHRNQGFVHYQRNGGYGSAAAIAALPSQNPGINFLPNTIFGAVPEISSDVLAKAFQLDKKVVMDLQKKF
ncbi:hypothetical protein L6164_033156 [Bauhinia variegata]|uniref:Uncharacterized protein n=1 Tax=Bauhinia variegata TaxID=167791 RepID=A0ACB9KQX6_BAUVA|nr:hypothetical protein L6164_033156 [Bauhinia variegata]